MIFRWLVMILDTPKIITFATTNYNLTEFIYCDNQRTKRNYRAH